MNIRRFHAAVLAVALGTASLAAPAAATAQTSSATTQTGTQILWVGPFINMTACNEYRDYVLAHPPYSFVWPCEYNTDLPRAGFYFLVGY